MKSGTWGAAIVAVLLGSAQAAWAEKEIKLEGTKLPVRIPDDWVATADGQVDKFATTEGHTIGTLALLGMSCPEFLGLQRPKVTSPNKIVEAPGAVAGWSGYIVERPGFLSTSLPMRDGIYCRDVAVNGKTLATVVDAPEEYLAALVTVVDAGVVRLTGPRDTVTVPEPEAAATADACLGAASSFVGVAPRRDPSARYDSSELSAWVRAVNEACQTNAWSASNARCIGAADSAEALQLCLAALTPEQRQAAEAAVPTLRLSGPEPAPFTPSSSSGGLLAKLRPRRYEAGILMMDVGTDDFLTSERGAGVSLEIGRPLYGDSLLAAGYRARLQPSSVGLAAFVEGAAGINLRILSLQAIGGIGGAGDSAPFKPYAGGQIDLLLGANGGGGVETSLARAWFEGGQTTRIDFRFFFSGGNRAYMLGGTYEQRLDSRMIVFGGGTLLVPDF